MPKAFNTDTDGISAIKIKLSNKNGNLLAAKSEEITFLLLMEVKKFMKFCLIPCST